MKTRIYTFLLLPTLLLFTVRLQGEVITATSEPFVFGDPSPVPLSPLAIALTVILIVGFLTLRFFKGKKQAV